MKIFVSRNFDKGTTITTDRDICVSANVLENMQMARRLGSVVIALGVNRPQEVYHLITSTALKHMEEELRDYECLKLSLQDDLK